MSTKRPARTAAPTCFAPDNVEDDMDIDEGAEERYIFTNHTAYNLPRHRAQF